jgi:predicted metalloprotease with PDZ domain
VTEQVAYLGVILQDDSGPGIYGVLDTSPAGSSGLSPDDVITGVNGYGFSVKALKFAVAEAAPVQLDVRRGHQLRRYTTSPGMRTAITGLIWNSDAAAARRIGAWLGHDFQPTPGTTVPLDFYENFHGVETVI